MQFSDILKDGMGFPAVANIPTFGLFQIVAFAGFAEIGAMPAAQYTGGPQNLPGGYDGSVGTIPGGYPFTTQIEDVTARNRALTCELQNGRAAMLGTFGAAVPLCASTGRPPTGACRAHAQQGASSPSRTPSSMFRRLRTLVPVITVEPVPILAQAVVERAAGRVCLDARPSLACGSVETAWGARGSNAN